MICKNIYIYSSILRSLPEQSSRSADGFIRSSAFEIILKSQIYFKKILWSMHLLLHNKQTHQSPLLFKCHLSKPSWCSCFFHTRVQLTASYQSKRTTLTWPTGSFWLNSYFPSWCMWRYSSYHQCNLPIYLVFTIESGRKYEFLKWETRRKKITEWLLSALSHTLFPLEH